MIFGPASKACCCIPSNVHIDKKTVKNVAFALDWFAAITLLVLGILFMLGTISLSPAAGYIIFGMGLLYFTAMLLKAFNKRDFICRSH